MEFTEFRFEKGEMKLAISRGHLLSDSAESPRPHAVPDTVERQVSTPPAASQPAQPDRGPSPGKVHVTAPMLGAFYRSPKPGEPPFVEVGAIVAAGDLLCIIEVMKLMSSVVAEVAGEITAVLARDGELVEFEQPLFEIRPLP
ncbi:MAG: biotin/lipoyl-containing protein [Pseudolysinimonas sp.]|uniref:acetyl-CoA carboxylase biotin carboxyl carrier protein n=1 Tax=Pseudolysinimonas sp. TaxID=2680009 RepID=UPI003C7238D2